MIKRSSNTVKYYDVQLFRNWMRQNHKRVLEGYRTEMMIGFMILSVNNSN